MSDIDLSLSPLEKSIVDLEGQFKQEQEKQAPQDETVVDKALEENTDDTESEQEDGDTREEEKSSDGEDQEEDTEIPEGGKANSAFAGMRKKNKELEDSNRQLVERLAKLEGKFEATSQFTGQQQAPLQDENPEPDRDLDPDQWMQWKFSKQEELISQQNQMLQQNQQNQQVMQARNELNTYEQQYTQSNSDFTAAKDFLRNSYAQELKIQYPNATDMQINNQISNEELRLGSMSVNSGVNPGETIFKLAKSRGFNAQAPKKTIDTQKIKQNKRKSASLNGSSSVASSDLPSAQDVVNMSLEKMMSLGGGNLRAIEESARNS